MCNDECCIDNRLLIIHLVYAASCIDIMGYYSIVVLKIYTKPSRY